MCMDLGLDQIKVYTIQDDSQLKKLTEISLPAGSGPRHLAQHPIESQYLYVFGELDNTITVLDWDRKTLSAKQIQVISTLPNDFTAHS